jgi:hypothetical protein
MSALRIIGGFVVGASFIAICMTVFWWFSLPLWVLVAFFLAAGYVASLELRAQERNALQQHRERTCMGLRSRRRFPGSPKADIREFLELFCDAFNFTRGSRRRFSPDDRVVEVYRASYPDRLMPNALELETLESRFLQRYGVDMRGFWREDITLGEVYSYTNMP